MSEPPKAYRAHNRSLRQWRYAEHERPTTAQCYDCDLPYASPGFGDLTLPNEVWEKINPTYEPGCGLLCPRCIFERLAAINHYGITSGVAIWPSSFEPPE